MVTYEEELMLPVNIYTSKEINALSPAERKRYYQQFLISVLKSNPDGVTTSSLVRALKDKKINYNDKSLQKHLNYLVLIREAYAKKHGNSNVFYLNGKLLWDKKRRSFDVGKKAYSFFALDNPRGKFIVIQEKEKNNFNVENVTGGIVIPKERFIDFIHHLNEFVNDIGGVDK